MLLVLLFGISRRDAIVRESSVRLVSVAGLGISCLKHDASLENALNVPCICVLELARHLSAMT